MPWKIKTPDKVTYSYEGTPIEVDVILGGFCVRSTETGKEDSYNNYSAARDGSFPRKVLSYVLGRYGISESPPIPKRFSKWPKRVQLGMF